MTNDQYLDGYYSVVYKGERVRIVRLCGALIDPDGVAAVKCQRRTVTQGDRITGLHSFKVTAETLRGTWTLRVRATFVKHPGKVSKTAATAEVV